MPCTCTTFSPQWALHRRSDGALWLEHLTTMNVNYQCQRKTLKIRFKMKFQFGRKETWPAELFSRYLIKKYIILHILVDHSGAGVLPWHGGKWWQVRIILHQRELASSCQCMLTLAFKICFFVLLVTAINFAFFSRAPDWCTSVSLCLSSQPWPCPALSAADLLGCAPLCFILRTGWCWGATRSFYGLNFEWQKESNSDLMKAEVFL